MKKYIAITGGIGSGKSTAVSYIRSIGYPVFSCDEIYKEIIKDREYVQEIANAFAGVVKENSIDKKALATLIFSNEEARKKLDSLAHPKIMKRLFERMRLSEGNIVFAEVPLLFENGFEKEFDGVIVIMRDLSKRIAAIIQRDGGTRENIMQKIAAQFAYEKKENSSKLHGNNIWIIDNNTNEEMLYKKLQECIPILINSLS